jgi:hypothetical protein
MIFSEIIALYFVNYMKHITAIWGIIQSSLVLKEYDTRVNHCALQVKNCLLLVLILSHE